MVTGVDEKTNDYIIIHIGCGLDSRVERVGLANHFWFDVDFPEVIQERRRYYCESEKYRMIEADVRDCTWSKNMPTGKAAIVVLEGVSMYLTVEESKHLLKSIKKHFEHSSILMDCYTVFAAKASKYKNPVNDVVVTNVYGMDNPKLLEETIGVSFVKEHDMTPDHLINELCGVERYIFKRIYGGNISRKLYRLYEYGSVRNIE